MENEKEQGQRPKKGDDKRQIRPDEEVREPQRSPAKPEGPGETGEPELPSTDPDVDDDEIVDEDTEEPDENV